MNVMPFHIAAGTLALAGGFAAMFAPKGGWLHRRGGMLFVHTMLLLGASAAIVGAQRGKAVPNAFAFALIVYFVVTAVTTLRPRTPITRNLDIGLLVVGLVVGLGSLAGGYELSMTPDELSGGVPASSRAFASYVNGVLALLAVAGDVRVLRSGPLRGAPRLRRHLWRMCFALFIAAGSFFLGQAKVLPAQFRIMPLLFFVSFLPFIVLLYWFWRTRARGTRLPSYLRLGNQEVEVSK